LVDTPPELNDGDKTIERAIGEIEFKQVSVQYENAKKAAISQLSFHVQPGEKVALVGRSGGGKTTLINLLPRFYELKEGLILLDGIDVRALDLENLRAQFSLVSQDIVLFNDTLFNNIAYGALRHASESDVIAAAKAAHAWDFIEQMPEGLQTLDTLMQGRTTIVIAHRLSTIENADRILVLDKGKVVESGTHQDLLKEKGYYSQLYKKEYEA